VTLSEQAALSPEARDEFRLWARRTTTNYAALLAECRDEGSFDWPGDIEVATNLILSTLNSVHRWFHPTETMNVAMLATQVARLFSGVFTAPDMTHWPMPELPTSKISLEEEPGAVLTSV
jgi:hypothetical protein